LSTVKQNFQWVESNERRKNVILWNALASDAESAKVVFEKVVKGRLEYEHNCNYSVLEFGKEKKLYQGWDTLYRDSTGIAEKRLKIKQKGCFELS